MARLNEILVGRFNKFFQKSYGIKGPPPVATLAPEIMPVHGIFHGAENRYLEGWNRYGASVSVAAQAAATNGARIRNPTGSNAIVVLEKLIATASIAQTLNAGFSIPGNADLAISGPAPSSLDNRNISSSIASVSSAITSPGVTNVIERPGVLAGAAYAFFNFEDQELIVNAGVAIDVVTAVVNALLTVSWVWRERQLEEGERL